MSKLRFLITAGPTREVIDPVRYISNRSSGKMGFSLAESAAERGHHVHLISGPVSLETLSHPYVETTRVESAHEMYRAVESNILQADVAIMTAAVSDYRPSSVSSQKIKKTKEEELVLHLERTEDILGSAREKMGFAGILVGFAAETEKLEEYARGKLERKNCDLIVANDVSRSDIGFDVPENEIALFYRDGRSESMRKASKNVLANQLLTLIEQLASAE
ncbi:MAG: phosphopantothenoylcysteine decarboxylase [Verrucomicrobiota bacterium]